MELRPRLRTDEFSTKAYSQDIKKFGMALDILNKNNKEEGEYTSEDLFSFLLSHGLDNMPDVKEGLKKYSLGRKKLSRRSNKNEILN